MVKRVKPSIYGIHPSVERWAGHAEMPPEYAGAAAYLATAERYVEDMFSGPKAALRPIYDALLMLGLTIGKDTKACPCKTIVPIYRHHVFAQIKPATQKRIDLGFALGEEPFTSRLHGTGGLAKKDRITHSVALTSLNDIDLQIKRWLKEAYQRDA